MAKAKPDPALSAYVMTRAMRRSASRMALERNTCPGCRTIYITYAHSVTCENGHKQAG